MTDAAEPSEADSPAPTSGLGAVITSLLVWASLRLILVTTPWSAVRARKKVGATDDVDRRKLVAPERAEFVFNVGTAAQDHTDDKAKHLLALASSVAAFLVVFAPSIRPAWPGFVAVGTLLICVSLCVFLLGVRHHMLPTPEPKDVDSDGHVWAYDLLRSAISNEQHQRFSVDLYAAARRWFFIALFFLSLILLLPQQAEQDPVAASVAELSSVVQEKTGALREELKLLRDELEATRLQAGAMPADTDSATSHQHLEKR